MIIFNADDYGLTDKDSSLIDHSLKIGVIRSTTVVTNIRESNRLPDTPNISVGLHLNLVEGKALSRISPLTDLDGNFLGKKNFLLAMLNGSISSHDIKSEIDAQILSLLNSGISISHVDTHQNMHIYPMVLKALLEVSSKYSINKIRGQHSCYDWFGKKPSQFKATVKKLASIVWNNKIPNDWTYSQKIVLGAPGLGKQCVSIEEACRLWDYALKNYYNPSVVYEVPCHLGLCQFEYDLYNSNIFSEVLIKNAVRVGSFNDL